MGICSFFTPKGLEPDRREAKGKQSGELFAADSREGPVPRGQYAQADGESDCPQPNTQGFILCGGYLFFFLPLFPAQQFFRKSRKAVDALRKRLRRLIRLSVPRPLGKCRQVFRHTADLAVVDILPGA